ncbi:unnamed protein product [Phytophthora fragariaefolia]|uniref:Unnamed protein product n=1 Tax=Phytophthora fragariaefolia TaxID=1490495 RepID=A0A9W7D9F0_9STRA|nr:unnamed protein product [Phytophthora fragariaefolia]
MQFSLSQAKLFLHDKRDRRFESTWVRSEGIGLQRPISKSLHEPDDLCRLVYRIGHDVRDQGQQNGFRSRAEFLDLQQGKHDMHAYAQRARYLVSNIVTNPIDEAAKVVRFMKGLRDGPLKTYPFREYPSTLEAAITLVMQE